MYLDFNIYYSNWDCDGMMSKMLKLKVKKKKEDGIVVISFFMKGKNKFIHRRYQNPKIPKKNPKVSKEKNPKATLRTNFDQTKKTLSTNNKPKATIVQDE